MSTRYRLPGNKKLLDLDGDPTDDRKAWVAARWEHVRSLSGFAQLEPNAVRILRRIVRHPRYAHGSASLVVDQRDVAKALKLDRKTVNRQLRKIRELGLLDADPLERGPRQRWLPRVFHLAGLEASRWHRGTRSRYTVEVHGGGTALLTGEDTEEPTGQLVAAGGSSSLISNGQDEVGSQADEFYSRRNGSEPSAFALGSSPDDEPSSRELALIEEWHRLLARSPESRGEERQIGKRIDAIQGEIQKLRVGHAVAPTDARLDSMDWDEGVAIHDHPDAPDQAPTTA